MTTRSQGAAAGNVLPPGASVGLTGKERASGHFLAAVVARFEHDWGTATRETAKAVAADPGQARLRAEYAELLVRAGDLAEAREQAAALATLEPSDVEPRLFLARIDIARQDYSLAVLGCEQVLGQDPSNEEALVLAGALYNRLGQPEKAVVVLRRAVASDHDSLAARFGLGKALAASGDYRGALEALREAERLNSSIGDIHLHKAWVYERLGMRREAVESFNRAIEAQPQLEEARRQLGALDLADPDLDQKLHRYERLVDFAEDPLLTCAKLALLDIQRGEMLRAITGLHLVLAARPGEDEMRYWLALACDKVGDTEGTARELAAISRRSPRYVDARLFLSSVLEQAGDLPGAIRAVEKLLENDSGNADALRRAVALYREQKRYGDAIAVAERLVALEPRNDSYLYGLAWLHDEAGHKAKTITTLRRVLEVNPANADALNHLGYTWAEKGENLDEAEHLIRRALSIRPDSPAILDSLAWVHFQRGDAVAAVKDLEKAAGEGGGDPVIVEHLGDVYRKLGRDLQADLCYRDAAARSEDPAQRQGLQRKMAELRQAWGVASPAPLSPSEATKPGPATGASRNAAH